MPVDSSQISQIMAAQQAALINSNAYAQQISAMNPMVAAYNRQTGANPLTMGSIQAGGAGSEAVGTAATVGALGVGISAAFGMAPRIFDPFTGVAAAASYGGGGAGLAGGIGMGALAAGGYLAMGAAANFVTKNFMQGAQQQVHMMGTLGAGMGGAGMEINPSLQNTSSMASEAFNIADTSGGLVSPDSMASIVGMGMQTGQFSGVSSVSQFSKKLKQLTSQATQMSRMLKTSIEQGAAELSRLNQEFGFSGNEAVGFSAMMRNQMPSLDPMTQTAMASAGGDLFQQMGLSRAAGGYVGLRAGQTITAAADAGIISAGRVNEMGGAAAATARFTQASARILSGRQGMQLLGAMMTETGGLDVEMAQRVASGSISREEMMKAYRANAGGAAGRRKLAAYGTDIMGEFMEQHGVGGAAGALGVMTGGKSDEMLRGMQMSGLGRQDFQTFSDLGGGGSSFARVNMMTQAIRQGADQGAPGSNSLGEAVDKAIDRLTEPVRKKLNQWGRDMSQGITQYVDQIGRDVTGVGSGRPASAMNVDSSPFFRQMQLSQMGYAEQGPGFASTGGDGGALFAGVAGGGINFSSGLTGEPSQTGIGGYMRDFMPMGAKHGMAGGDPWDVSGTFAHSGGGLNPIGLGAIEGASRAAGSYMAGAGRIAGGSEWLNAAGRGRGMLGMLGHRMTGYTSATALGAAGEPLMLGGKGMMEKSAEMAAKATEKNVERWMASNAGRTMPAWQRGAAWLGGRTTGVAMRGGAGLAMRAGGLALRAMSKVAGPLAIASLAYDAYSIGGSLAGFFDEEGIMGKTAEGMEGLRKAGFGGDVFSRRVSGWATGSGEGGVEEGLGEGLTPLTGTKSGWFGAQTYVDTNRLDELQDQIRRVTDPGMLSEATNLSVTQIVGEAADLVEQASEYTIKNFIQGNSAQAESQAMAEILSGHTGRDTTLGKLAAYYQAAGTPDQDEMLKNLGYLGGGKTAGAVDRGGMSIGRMSQVTTEDWKQWGEGVGVLAERTTSSLTALYSKKGFASAAVLGKAGGEEWRRSSFGGGEMGVSGQGRSYEQLYKFVSGKEGGMQGKWYQANRVLLAGGPEGYRNLERFEQLAEKLEEDTPEAAAAMGEDVGALFGTLMADLRGDSGHWNAMRGDPGARRVYLENWLQEQSKKKDNPGKWLNDARQGMPQLEIMFGGATDIQSKASDLGAMQTFASDLRGGFGRWQRQMLKNQAGGLGEMMRRAGAGTEAIEAIGAYGTSLQKLSAMRPTPLTQGAYAAAVGGVFGPDGTLATAQASLSTLSDDALETAVSDLEATQMPENMQLAATGRALGGARGMVRAYGARGRRRGRGQLEMLGKMFGDDEITRNLGSADVIAAYKRTGQLPEQIRLGLIRRRTQQISGLDLGPDANAGEIAAEQVNWHLNAVKDGYNVQEQAAEEFRNTASMTGRTSTTKGRDAIGGLEGEAEDFKKQLGGMNEALSKFIGGLAGSK